MFEDLDSIAKKNKTDKCSDVHNYCEKYERYFRFDRKQKLKILEIGVFLGGSVKTWSEYFPNSDIIGIDIKESCRQFEDERIKIEIGSQTDEKFIEHIIEKYKEFDLIIDDGSHIQKDVIKSFNLLFPSLKNRGLYVIEDSCCSYWANYGGGYKKENTSIEYFKELVDHVSFFGQMLDDKPRHARREDRLIKDAEIKRRNTRLDIESISFLNSIILINKR